MEADNPAGPAPIMIVSYIFNTPIFDWVWQLLSACDGHTFFQWRQARTDATFVVDGHTALEAMPDITINPAGFIIFLRTSYGSYAISKKGGGNRPTFVPGRGLTAICK